MIILTASLAVTSCKDFLDEEQVATLSYEYYNTEQGIEDLVKSCYAPLRFKTGMEQTYCLWNFGTDEYMQSGQTGWKYFNEYGSELNSSQEYIGALWDNNYNAINRCNNAMERIPGITGTAFLANDAGKKTRMAEVRFLRGYYYFQMVQQYGSLPLKLKASVGVELEFEKSPVPDIYKSIISDLRFAADALPEKQTDYGRATSNAARHYLAKVYLTRGSAVTAQRGQQPTDMDSAAYYADLCINSPETDLVPDYAQLWDYKNQVNKEIVFASQFNADQTLLTGAGIGYQNTTHLYFLNQYDNEPGMGRVVSYGRPYRRLMPTDYAYDIHDRLNDSRLRKSLLTVFICNKESSIPKWTEPELKSFGGDLSLAGKPKFAIGDTALVFLVNDKTTTLTDRQITSKGYTIYARYYWATDTNGNPTTLKTGYKIDKAPSLWKYVDPFRSNADDTKGTRDHFLARLAETYLIAAEAYGRKGDYATALTRINEVRKRAAYHAGEAKPSDWYLYDGGTPGDLNSTEAAMLATEDHFSETDNSYTTREQYPTGITSKQQRFIHFILNERCRELLGELHRWEDLARTETLLLRAYVFNPDVVKAGTLAEKHTLRPIPQTYLERVYRNGKPLTSAERLAEQNPGY
jgi:hypothetical protein